MKRLILSTESIILLFMELLGCQTKNKYEGKVYWATIAFNEGMVTEELFLLTDTTYCEIGYGFVDNTKYYNYGSYQIKDSLLILHPLDYEMLCTEYIMDKEKSQVRNSEQCSYPGGIHSFTLEKGVLNK